MVKRKYLSDFAETSIKNEVCFLIYNKKSGNEDVAGPNSFRSAFGGTYLLKQGKPVRDG
jgi:hypothetical protein